LPGVRSLHGLPIKIVAALLEEAECVITLENGIAHLCSAVDAHMVEIYSTMVPLVWAFPREMTHVEAIYENPRLVSVERVLGAVERVLRVK
jgi:ADP-heptose:LPS heptosyltransferase